MGWEVARTGLGHHSRRQWGTLQGRAPLPSLEASSRVTTPPSALGVSMPASACSQLQVGLGGSAWPGMGLGTCCMGSASTGMAMVVGAGTSCLPFRAASPSSFNLTCDSQQPQEPTLHGLVAGHSPKLGNLFSKPLTLTLFHPGLKCWFAAFELFSGPSHTISTSCCPFEMLPRVPVMRWGGQYRPWKTKDTKAYSSGFQPI